MNVVKNVVITGGSSGIGFEIAEKFASNNHDVLIVSKDPIRLQHAVNKLDKMSASGVVRSINADLSSKKEVYKVIDFINSSFKTVDILINNVGIFIPGTISEEPESRLEETLAINLFAPYFLTKGILPKLQVSMHPIIVNICSTASLQSFPNSGSYGISKYALKGFNDNLRNELQKEGIRVTGIYPGATFTSSWNKSGIGKEKMLDPADIGSIVYLLSQLHSNTQIDSIVLRPQSGDISDADFR